MSAMSITCPRCGSEFDATLFQFGNSVRCRCGTEVKYPGADLRAGHVVARSEDSEIAYPASTADKSLALTERCWEVWRQGDDGNAFVVQSDLTEREADDLVAVFESRGHKQVYWKTKAK
jgi:DNA-directed RNA polymerase subunit RPC12/RpoP